MLFAVVCSLLAAGARAVVDGPQHPHLAARESAKLTLRNETTSRDETSDFPPAGTAGDMTCMRWTGGRCAVSACKTERGPTVCEAGFCMCEVGTCADATGACTTDAKGEWLEGEYAIRFANPYVKDKPYLGADKEVLGEGWILASPVQRVEHVAGLAATASSLPQWRIALTGHGHARFTNVNYPGSALIFYMDRRQLLLQQDASALRGTNRSQIPDSDNVWPILAKFESVRPLQVDFQIRITHQNGGGLEIWDPKVKAALSSGNPDWWFKDDVAAAGVAECDVDHAHTNWRGECEGRQLVSFEPELPSSVRLEGGRHYIREIALYYGWQAVLICCCICAIACAINCATKSNDGFYIMGEGGDGF